MEDKFVHIRGIKNWANDQRYLQPVIHSLQLLLAVLSSHKDICDTIIQWKMGFLYSLVFCHCCCLMKYSVTPSVWMRQCLSTNWQSARIFVFVRYHHPVYLYQTVELLEHYFDCVALCFVCNFYKFYYTLLYLKASKRNQLL